LIPHFLFANGLSRLQIAFEAEENYKLAWKVLYKFLKSFGTFLEYQKKRRTLISWKIHLIFFEPKNPKKLRIREVIIQSNEP